MGDVLRRRYCAFMATGKAPGMAFRHKGPKGPTLWRSTSHPEAVYGGEYGGYGGSRPWAAIVAQVVEQARLARKARVMFGRQP